MEFPHLLRLIIAGILAIPALLSLITIAPLIILLSIPSLAILVRRKRNLFPSFDSSQLSKSSSDSTNTYDKGHTTQPLLQHAVITGGSSGIGLSIAIELAKQRCRNITLLARNEQQLVTAKLLVEKAAAAATTTSSTISTTSVHILSVDVTDFSALEKAVANHISSSINTATPGPPTLLFHCAGMSIPLAFEDLSASNFYKQMNVNYLGSVHVVKAFLPYMTNTIQQQQQQQHSIGGNIILTSSMSGQTGTFGYSGYSPTKFALRGFAECLSMELAAKKSNVNISLAYPPDTKTPGYEIENRNKPEECRLISEGSGIWDPDV